LPSFTDIAPIEEIVTLRGLDFPVHALGIDDLGKLLHRFPELRTLLPTAAAPGTAPPEVDAVSIIGLGRQIVAALIACATDKAGDKEEEEALAGLAVGEQFLFIEAIIRLSVPGGLTPLMQRVAGLMSGERPAADGAGRALDSNSLSPSMS
jgi:hypothetical protein